MGYAYFVLNFVLEKILSSGFDVDSYEKPMINGDFALTSLKFVLIALLGFCDHTIYLAFLELGIHESVRVGLSIVLYFPQTIYSFTLFLEFLHSDSAIGIYFPEAAISGNTLLPSVFLDFFFQQFH